MFVVDPISDMFVRINNANKKFHERVDIPFSKIKFEIAKILKNEGYILDCKNIKDVSNKNVLQIILKYVFKNKPVICGIKRISKSSSRIYKGYKDIPLTVSGLGITIISTPNGLMTDKQAKINKIGGEIIGCIW